MATAVADLEAVEAVNAGGETGSDQQYILPPRLMARLESMAAKRGWTPGEALVRALNVAEIVFDAKDDPTTEVYIHRQGKRYSLEIPR